MGSINGFMELQRAGFHYRPVEERLGDYREFMSVQPESVLREQASRCMDCGIPFCHSMGCPVYNLIPEWNDLLYHGKWKEAYERLELTNSLPEVTGRVCPAPCEAACTLSINSAPVAIKQIELALVERAFEEGWAVPRPPREESGARVAVVGSGPAGLAAAGHLRRMGHSVVVFEQDDKPGGILRYGIPDFKLGKHVIDRRIDLMRREGVRFETNVVIGEDISVRYLRRSFDALMLTMGAGEPRDLHVPGRGLEGIHFAMNFLTLSNKFVAGQMREDEIISARNKVVLVIGGGDTGADCVGTANRQGAEAIHQFEIMPRPLSWDKPWNPHWPNWPRILRSSSSHEEGCVREWGISTKRFGGRDVRVESADFTRVEWESDENGRMRMREVPDSEFSLKVDMVLLAMGFVHVRHGKLLEDLDVELDRRGNVTCNSDYMTTVPSVFVAGDVNSGASLVVRAIFHGRRAAEGVDRFLRSRD